MDEKLSGAVVMDLSKCGGTCRGDCKHYQIGIDCEDSQKYEPSSPWSAGCECSSWCRAEQQDIRDKHHKNCPRYNETIRVVKITHEGQSCIDADIPGALQSLADSDNYCYQVEIMDMLKREYDVLPEFTGF